jgi:hypothetical protein
MLLAQSVLLSCSEEKPVYSTSISLAEDLLIGSIDGPDDAFSAISDIEIGFDGRVYVLLPFEATVRVFSKSGEFLFRFGSRGHGPGEFTNPQLLGIHDDQLWVVDPPYVHYFDLAGNHEHTISIPTPAISRFSSVGAAVPLKAGGFLGIPSVQLEGLVRGEIRATPLVRFDRRSEATMDTVALLRSTGNEVLIAESRLPGAGPMYVTQPIKDRPLYQLASRGDRLAVVDRRVAGHKRRATYSVTMIHLPTDTVYQQEIPYDPVPFDAMVLEDVLDRAFGGANPLTLISREELYKLSWKPMYLPPVSSFVVGDDGRLWVGRERLPSRSTLQWDVLDRHGNLEGSAELPTTDRIMRASSDYLWAVRHDSLGVPYLVRYSVVSK